MPCSLSRHPWDLPRQMDMLPVSSSSLGTVSSRPGGRHLGSRGGVRGNVPAIASSGEVAKVAESDELAGTVTDLNSELETVTWYSLLRVRHHLQFNS